ncbi:hypothetical protein [Agrobacterium sp. CG674]
MRHKEKEPSNHGDGSGTRPAFLSDRQRAEVSLSLNKDSGLTAKAEMSNGGVLSISTIHAYGPGFTLLFH